MIEVQKKHVYISCTDGISMRADVEINGERTIFDLLNSPDQFILLYDVDVAYLEDVQSFRLSSKATEKKPRVVLNKNFIKWIMES